MSLFLLIFYLIVGEQQDFKNGLHKAYKTPEKAAPTKYVNEFEGMKESFLFSTTIVISDKIEKITILQYWQE